MTILDKSNTPSIVDFQAGAVLLIDKSTDWTSFDVVAKVRGMLRYRLQVKKIKVGHAGTLDPMATGMLIICTGKYTKKIVEFQDLTKRYVGEMLFGATTPSYDGESDIDKTFDISKIDIDAIETKVKEVFTGDILQEPPMFSAIKIKGQRLYKLARKGKTIERPKRKIHIYDYSIDTSDFPIVKFDVTCSKGTYIRSLVHDLGLEMNSGAYMTALRRTAIGDYSIDKAMNIVEFEEYIDTLDFSNFL